MSRTQNRGDLSGRLLAILLILGGVSALVFVFIKASQLFSSPVPGLGLPLAAGAPAPPAASIGIALALLVRQIALLLLMIVAGSMVASKGIHLYYWTFRGADEPRIPIDEEPKETPSTKPLLKATAPAKPSEPAQISREA